MYRKGYRFRAQSTRDSNGAERRPCIYDRRWDHDASAAANEAARRAVRTLDDGELVEVVEYALGAALVRTGCGAEGWLG